MEDRRRHVTGCRRVRLLRFAAAVACFAASVFPAAALENGQSHYVKGWRDFLTGVLPQPGLTIRNDIYVYNGTQTIFTPQGVRVDASLNAVADILSPIYVTQYQILGGNYAFGARLGVSDIWSDRTTTTPRGASTVHGEANGLNDILVAPFILGWHVGNFHWNIAATAWVPAGYYDATHLVNPGRNYWTGAPQAGFTYFDPRSGWDISIASGYLINASNQTTGYRSGDVLHVDYAVGKQLTPHFKLGLVGYVMQQITGDSGPGDTLGSFKARVYGLGPAASVMFTVADRPLILQAKYYREFAAQNTTQGNAGMVSATFRF